MTVTIVLVAIWLIGSVICYIITRQSTVKSHGKWTTGDRAMNIFFSMIGSWAGILFTLFVDYIMKNDTKEAKW